MLPLISFAVSLLALLSGHALLWYVYLRFFNITSQPEQIVAAAIFLLLFVGIIASSYLIHKWDNLFTRSYYLFSTLWIGVFVNLSLMTVIIILIKVIGPKMNFFLPDAWLPYIFYGGAGLICAQGIYNGWVPKIVEYTVYIKDLPTAWDNKTVVQISDVHLGPVYRKKFFYRLIEQVNRLRPEAVFITGDLYDGIESDFSWMNHPFTNLHPPRGTYYSYGNHDLYLGYSRVRELLKDNPVEILNNKMKVVEGLQIIGINYSFNNDFDLEAAILKQVEYTPERPSILLFHAPRNIKLAKKVGIDLQLSGHTHDGQMFPLNLVIKWAHQGYGYGFFQEDDFNLIVSGGVGAWGPPLRTSARSEIVKINLKKKLAVEMIK